MFCTSQKARHALHDELSFYQHGGAERIRTSAPVTQPNDLANRPLQPLEYRSVAERVGFEPTVRCRITGFQDQLHKPLGHLSKQVYILANYMPVCQSLNP